MSRGQQNQIFNTATADSTTDNNNAQTAFTKAQGDVGTFESQLGKFASSNPYVQGGEYATIQNQSLADTANAGANATSQAIQSAAVHGGANPAQAIAASEEVAQQNQRTLGQQEAEANQQRIGAEAGYNEKALSGYGTAAQMQDQLANQQGQLAEGVLGIGEKAAAEPSTADVVTKDILQAGQDAAMAFGGGKGCWIAARLWGGWNDRRTVLVRLWLNIAFAQRWYGKPVMKLYARIGERIADHWMPKSKVVTWVLGKLFERALVEAEVWLVTRQGSLAYGTYFQFQARYSSTWPRNRMKQFSDAALRTTLKLTGHACAESQRGREQGVVAATPVEEVR